MKLFGTFAPDTLSTRALRRPLHVPLKRLAPHSSRRSTHRYISDAVRASRPASQPCRPLLARAQFSPLRQRWHAGLRDLRSIRHGSSGPNPNPTAQLGSPNGKPSLGDQLKRLFREYGWAGVGVYLLLSAADLPICLLIVRLVGTERVGAAEHAVLEWIRGAWRAVNPLSAVGAKPQTMPLVEDTKAVAEEGVANANAAADEGEASIWTQLALAYAIHKSLFVFIRVPLTVAITPKVVKTLRGWGWQIGKRPMRPSKAS